MKIFEKVKAWRERPIEKNFQVLLRKFRRLSISTFEAWKGYDFSGVISNADLKGNAESMANATAYQAYSPDQTLELLNELFLWKTDFRRFIDVGCGKGRQCIHVARRLDFPEVLGIDFSEELVSIAKVNLGRSNDKVKRSTRFITADARNWKLPEGRNVVFLFNPFDSELLDAFVKNNVDNFLNDGSVIVYASDNNCEALIENGFDVIYRSIEIRSSILVLAKRN
jgi:SAM-dependent methyltransferase